MTFLPRKSQQVLVGDEMSRAAVSKPVGPDCSASDNKSSGCQWIDGPVTGDDGCKCGKPVLADLPGRAPYCAEHAARCFESAAAWKKRNAWLGELDASFSTVSLKDWIGGLE